MKEVSRRAALKLISGGTVGVAGASWLDAAWLAMGKPDAPSRLADPSPRMNSRHIPSTGEAIPVIGLGTWKSFGVGASATERAGLEQVLASFAALGGRLVDSSPMYGRAERVVGDLTAKLSLRPRLFLATKVWTSGKAKGIEQMEESMRRMRAEPLDLIQVHNLVDVDHHLATLTEWKHAGRVRYIGVTHYTAGAHDDLAQVIAARKLDFVQVNYSAAEREAEERLLPLALDKGVAVIANRPFASGGLLSRLQGRPVPSWAAEIDCDTWAQLLLKFVVAHPAMTCAIPATSNPSHLRDNMMAGFGNMPGPDLRAKIASAVV